MGSFEPLAETAQDLAQCMRAIWPTCTTRRPSGIRVVLDHLSMHSLGPAYPQLPARAEAA
jgi:hypothetical protein